MLTTDRRHLTRHWWSAVGTRRRSSLRRRHVISGSLPVIHIYSGRTHHLVFGGRVVHIGTSSDLCIYRLIRDFVDACCWNSPHALSTYRCFEISYCTRRSTQLSHRFWRRQDLILQKRQKLPTCFDPDIHVKGRWACCLKASCGSIWQSVTFYHSFNRPTYGCFCIFYTETAICSASAWSDVFLTADQQEFHCLVYWIFLLHSIALTTKCYCSV